MSTVPAWLNQKETDHEHNAKVALATKAKETGRWIYDRTTRVWYTPTEFVFEKGISIPIHRHKPNYTNFDLIDPRDYVKVRIERIKSLTGEIETMEKRMWQYYDLVPKKQ